MAIAIFILGFFLSVDVFYSIYYFEYSYLLEIKRRFIAYNTPKMPIQYRQHLKNELDTERGNGRSIIQFLYWPWAILCLLTCLWYLPVFIAFLIMLTNSTYKKTYVSPVLLYINLVVMLVSYVYSIVYLS
jgi:hypothetical protein